MSSRKQTEVKSTMDQVSIVTVKFNVSGSSGGGDMTGSFIFGTDLACHVAFGSGSLSLPSGSMRVTLAPDNLYNKVLDWGVSFEGSGSTESSWPLTSPDATYGRPQNYRIVKYGHSDVSGTFDFGFVKQGVELASGSLSVGTGHWVGAVVKDEAHSTSPAAEVSLYAIVRNTDRNT